MKTIVAALLCGFGMFYCQTANAQYPVYRSPVVIQSVPINAPYGVAVQAYAAPFYNAYSVPVYAAPAYAPARPRMFERLMDLERRKNAWLRQTFLGRP